jgi:hypothetical protein
MYSQLPSVTGGRSSIRNLRTRHAVVTGTHLTRLMTSAPEVIHRTLKGLDCEAEHSPTFNAETNVWSHNSILSYIMNDHYKDTH